MRKSVIEFEKDFLSFSAGHFTVFSATERENLHGHNFFVGVSLHCTYDNKGLSFDYRLYKKKLGELCKRLDQITLIPTLNPFLQIEENDSAFLIKFNHEVLTFLKRDVLLLPAHNISVEELSAWFIARLLEDKETIVRHHIYAIDVRVFTGPQQSGSAHWDMASEAV